MRREQSSITESDNHRVQRVRAKRVISATTASQAAIQQRKKPPHRKQPNKKSVTTAVSSQSNGKKETAHITSNSRRENTFVRTIEDYLHDHEGGNHSPKTI